MPPPPSPPRPRRHRELAIDAAQLSSALKAFLPGDDDRAFVLRCVLDEGPVHHRGSNYVLLTLLVRLAQRLHADRPSPGPGRAFEMRLPPHLEDEIDERDWPLRVPEHALELAGHGDRRLMDVLADCLTDGPPQHSVANVLMLQLLTAMLEATTKARP